MAFQTLQPNVFWMIALLFVLLVIATVAVFVLKRKHPEKDFGELVLRIRTWWMMVVVFSLAMVLSRNISLMFFAFVSFLGLKEYFTMIPTRRADRRVLLWVYLAIPLQYLWVGMEWYGMFIIFIPVYLFLFLPLRMITIGEVHGFIHAVGTLHWGAMTMIFSLSHVANLLVLPAEVNPHAGGAGLVLYLVTLTQLNDISQYIWGKSLGQRKIVPTVSPNKTWEGFLGGLGTTVVISMILAPFLTPLSFLWSMVAGILIATSGFIGDVSISALKRDLGVKDSGTLLPGHGGILDRIDSLTYTAPLFFHFIYYLYY